jgi:hypothetical protein
MSRLSLSAVIILGGALALSACASGGSQSLPAPGATVVPPPLMPLPPPPPPLPPPPPSPVQYGPASAATKGSSPSGPEAYLAGPTMSAPVDGTVFPLLQTVLIDFTRPDDATMAAGATVTISGSVTNPSRLVIPNLGIDTSVTSAPGVHVFVGFGALQYSAYGAWAMELFEQNVFRRMHNAIAVIG